MNLLTKSMYYLALMAVMFLLKPTYLQAQTDVETEKLIISQLRAFAEAYVNLPNSKNKANVLRYFSKDATSNIFVFNISGLSRVQNGDYNGFDAYLDNLIRTQGITIGYEIGDRIDVEVSGNVATLVYRVNYETKIPDGIWVKGRELVTMALEKKAEEWKIVHYTFMQVEDEKLKGTCLCELFTSDGEDAEVVAKTTVPSGRSYTTKFDNMEFRTTGSDQMIKVQEKYFKRAGTGKLLAIKDGEEVEIGISNSKRETVLLVIEALYKDSCARIKAKN
ncbi:MAG: nuclear transport factor 2 family protein [Bacteroidia bacterium]|nr:nuclear transport factor 2 family protein [Bacteroidia bacterium]